jgi:hypothetical protein
MAKAKIELKGNEVYRDGELVATLNETGALEMLEGMSKYRLAVQAYLKSLEPAEEKKPEPKPESNPETPGIIPPPPPMEKTLGSKTPAYREWKKKYNPPRKMEDEYLKIHQSQMKGK